MKVIGKDRTSCDVCNPIDEILARLDALEKRASAIVAKVQGLAPDGEGNVTLPTSSSDTDPLHGRMDAFAMSSEVKEAADDAHAYATSIADDVVVLQSDVELLTKEVEALEFQVPNKVDRTGDTMTGPLNVIDTVTGSRNAQAVNGNRLQNDLDNYAPMVRNVGNQTLHGVYDFNQNPVVTKINPKIVFVDSREFSELTNSNILGGYNLFIPINGEFSPLATNEIRVSGFGVPGGVENMIYTHSYTEDKQILTAILTIRLDPTTRKAQLRFGNNVISEIDI